MAIEHDEPEPPRKEYGFKEREFKRENKSATGQPAMPTAKELAMMAGAVVKSGAQTSGGANRAADPNDPYAVLKHNRAVEKEHGLNEVQIKEIKSRRKRDFWLTLIGGNLTIIALVVFTGFNIVSVLFGLAGVIILTLSLTWIMWQVMDKY